MVGSEQVYHSPVSQYGGSKSEVVNKYSEQLERMVFGVRQHGEATRNTVLCLGVLTIKDGGH